jgi:hypothetical protein
MWLMPSWKRIGLLKLRKRYVLINQLPIYLFISLAVQLSRVEGITTTGVTMIVHETSEPCSLKRLEMRKGKQ